MLFQLLELEYLDLSRVIINQDILLNLGKLPCLTSLILERNATSLKPLGEGGFIHLERLCLFGNKVLEVEWLRKLKKLTHFELTHTKVIDTNQGPIKLDELEHCELDYSEITNMEWLEAPD